MKRFDYLQGFESARHVARIAYIQVVEPAWDPEL
jgi:hypothetical protein